MNIPAYYKSITHELESVKDRVRNFIDRKHWLTHGQWRESVLRSMLRNRLPDSVKIGHGFVITDSGPTTECDILIYRGDVPILFKDGDLVFVTPDAVLAIIEVKSTVTWNIYKNSITKLAAIGRKLGHHRNNCCLGLFAYDNTINNHEWILGHLQDLCKRQSQIVNLVNLGNSTFVRYWDFSPHGGIENYRHWHSYRLENMSPGYFIANVIDSISPASVAKHSRLWFPEESKEMRLEFTMPHASVLDQ